ncbi:kinase-like domain-containing protein [Annulohypoxylon moriforme]|nr:kinase-like domain-containing protein [Annulohypoxylon moriforme]
MATISPNHTHYQARLDYIKQILANDLNLPNKVVEQTEITPLQYKPNFPFKYNNFVYHLSLPTGVPSGLGDADGSRKLKQPGCVPIPAGTRDFIIRLSNPDADGIDQETRVQNEVGILTLAAAALRHIEPNVVPRVFAWSAAGCDHIGWILEEMMPGAPLKESFKTMSLDQKRGILVQMARLLKALQDYPLPDSIKGWGGVTFNNAGAIISASMSTIGAGPWPSFEESYRGRLKEALRKADVNPCLQGWRSNGVRERVDAFVERGLVVQFSTLTSKEERVITHGDFTTDNLLYDPETGRITALIDYDFSSIMHPAHEFFYSFNNTGGRLRGWLGEATPQEKEAELLRQAILTGHFPSPLPVSVASANSIGSKLDWALTQAWEVELQKLDVKRPSSIEGMDKIADVDELLARLEPWMLGNQDYLRLNPDEDHQMALRRKNERQVVGLLERMGF